MLISEEVEMVLNGKKIAKYKELGYNIPMKNDKENIPRVTIGTKIIVKIEDIPLGSHEIVDVKCDYCNKIFPVRYDAYNRQRLKFKIDCCNDCKINKIKHSNVETYGVENCGELDFVKDKIALSMSGSTVRTSQQQRYIKELMDKNYDCMLNYNDGETTYNFNLDIAIPNRNIYLEYDGSGHWLNIKFENISEDEFFRRELVRYNMLKTNNWKMIKIISRNDKFPTDEVLSNLINNGIDLLDNNTSVIYDIDNSYVKYNGNKYNYNFGELKRFV